MYMSGRVWKEPASPTAIMLMAPLPPRATTPAPFERVESQVDRAAPRADLLAGGQDATFLGGADHDRALDRDLLEGALHPG